MKVNNSELGHYYRLLAHREGLSPVDLAAPWDAADVAEITEDFRQAFDTCKFAENPLVVPIRTSNQSVGNRVAKFFSETVNHHLQVFSIINCVGNGYPDKRLVRWRDNREFALELKATGLFQPCNSNRLVLTSRSVKLRRSFKPPVNHLLLLIAYDRTDESLWLRSARLAFLNPDTQVSVRLEASVSHHFLSMASRTFVWANGNGGVT